MSDARDEILSECALAFGPDSDDCNKYVKAVCAVFFEPDLFTGPAMNADAIIDEMRGSGDWTRLDTDHARAIAAARAGQMVIAGMTSGELGDGHGHLAVVVGDDGQASGTVIVPICYAGSLNPAARVQRKRVSETFPAQMARNSKISYFARDVQALPEIAAVSRLADRLRGVFQPTAVVPLAATRTRRAPSAKRVA